MKLTLLFTSVLFLGHTLFATLPPTEVAPIGKHMQAVNAEWSHMWPEMASSEQPVVFVNEAARIRMHLELVVKKLSDPAQPARQLLLDALNNYAASETFPQNYVLPYRNPIFIDPHGTACAVGHLMRVSGATILAQEIDERSELCFIEEMQHPGISTWTSQHGFSSAELAWIQPGYPPNTVWTPPGGGVNGEVRAMTTLANGDILSAGAFDLGTPAINTVATWDGTAYTQIGNGLFGEVNDLIEFGGNIYAAGDFFFLNASHDLAVFDGTDWNYLTILPGLPAIGFDLHVHNGVLHLAGSSSGFAGTSYLVAAEQGGSWNLVGEALNAPVWTMETLNNELVIGGGFTATENGGTLMDHVAVLDNLGNWQEAFGGLNGEVHDLTIFNNNIYAGGELGDLADPRFGVAVRFPNETSWTDVLPGHENSLFPIAGQNEVRCLEFVGGQLFAGGVFDVTGIVGTFGQNIMWIDLNNTGFFEVQATANGPVNCMDEGIGISIFIGGEFDELNGQSNPHLSWSDVSVLSVPERDDLSISVVHQAQNRSHLATLDLRHLEQGTYMISIANSGVAELFVMDR